MAFEIGLVRLTPKTSYSLNSFYLKNLGGTEALYSLEIAFVKKLCSEIGKIKTAVNFNMISSIPPMSSSISRKVNTFR